LAGPLDRFICKGVLTAYKQTQSAAINSQKTITTESDIEDQGLELT